jgi:hypothetical protein
LIALLGFLAFLAYLAGNQRANAVVVNNPARVVIVSQGGNCTGRCTTQRLPTSASPPVIVLVTPATTVPGKEGDNCISLSGETLSEPPAFSLPFLQNDIRWSTAVWHVHYDDGQGYCRNSVVEGHDRLGRLTVRQFYGPHLAYRGQMTVKYLDDGTAQVNRFDSYNTYQGRDSYRVDASQVR